MSRHKAKWTPQEDALLKGLVMQGKSDTEIAASGLLDRSYHSIRYRRKDALRIDKREHWSLAEDARLKQLLSESRTLKEIGRILKRSEGGVERRKERLGLKRIPVKLSKHNPADIAQLVKFKMADWTHEKIAKIFDVHASYISNLLTANGFEGFCEVRPDRRGSCPVWTELELHTLRKCLQKKTLLLEICRKLPRRCRHAIRQQARKMTRYWLSPAEQAERQRSRKKQLRVY